MTDLIYDNLKQTVLSSLWENLKYPELIKFCSTSKEYTSILDDPLTWIYLFERDYNLTYNFSEELNLQNYYELHFLLDLPEYEEDDNLTFNSYYYSDDKMRNLAISGIKNKSADVDKYILAKLTTITSTQEKNPIKYAVFDQYGSILAKIKANNKYELVLKLLTHFQFEKHITIQSLLRAIYLDDIKRFYIISFTNLIDNLFELFHDRIGEEFFIIQRLDELKTF